MKKITTKRLATSAAILLGLGLSGQASAGAIAYSYLDISDFQVFNNTTGNQLDVTDFSFLDIGDSSSASAVTSFGGPAATASGNTADTALACSGSCGGIAENDPTQQVGSTNFGRGDTDGGGNIISGLPGGDSANAWVVSEGRQSSTGFTTAQSGARNATEFTLVVPVETTVRFDFNAAGEIFVELHQDEVIAFGSYSWNISVDDLDAGGAQVGLWAPNGSGGDPLCTAALDCQTLSDDFSLNDTHSVLNAGSDGTGGVQNGFFSITAVLQGDTRYRFQIGHASQINTDAVKVVPEPAMLLLMGAGLGGLGLSRRLRKAKKV